VTDEGSFSASSILACHLKTLAKAKIVGQTAGGSFYAGNAGTLKAKLPYTGFHLYVNPNTFYTHLTLENGVDPSKIKKPDYVIEPINPKIKKLDAWYVNNLTRYF
jgi:C-terminal processing protease CtpA/Prc